MSRPAAVIRTTVLALLAAARDRATLTRHLNAIEAELVQAGLAGFAVPDVPQKIAT